MNFYSNLTSSGVIFFWIGVFLIVLLILLIVILFIKNKKLASLLNDKEEKNLLHEEEKVEEDTNVVPLVSESKDIPVVDKEEKKEIKIEEETKQDKLSDTGIYQKNVLRELSRKMPTSPLGIKKDNYVVEDVDLDMSKSNDFISPLEEIEDSYEVNNDMKEFSDIVSKMEEEAKPSNIELTDYERKQEEEAIISYDELQKVKDRIYNITEDEETDEFIDELKKLRMDL